MDDHGPAELGRELELRVERAPLDVPRREVAVVVESRLPHRDGLRMCERCSQRGDAPFGRFVWMNPQRREHAVMLLGDRESVAPRWLVCPDADDACDARLTGALD